MWLRDVLLARAKQRSAKKTSVLRATFEDAKRTLAKLTSERRVLTDGELGDLAGSADAA